MYRGRERPPPKGKMFWVFTRHAPGEPDVRVSIDAYWERGDVIVQYIVDKGDGTPLYSWNDRGAMTVERAAYSGDIFFAVVRSPDRQGEARNAKQAVADWASKGIDGAIKAAPR